MGQRKFIGRREGNFMIVCGTVHEQSKKSFSYSALKRPIRIAYPVDDREFNRKRTRAGSDVDYRGNKAEGKTTNFSAAQKAVIAYCPLPSKISDSYVPREMGRIDSIFNDNVYEHKTVSRGMGDVTYGALAMMLMGAGLGAALRPEETIEQSVREFTMGSDYDKS